MLKLSENADQLLAQAWRLERTASWLGRTRRESQVAGLLSRLGETGEAAVLPHLYHYLRKHPESVRQAAKSAVARLISGMSAMELLELSESQDWSLVWYGDSKPQKLVQEFLPNDDQGGKNESQIAVLGLLSFHRNGYVRHEAVLRLSKFQCGSVLPFLLLRQNDWVDPVAEAARTEILSRIQEISVTDVVRYLPLILQLARVRRRDHQLVIHGALRVLLAAENDEFLRAVLTGPQREARRVVADHALRHSGEHKARVVRHGIQSEDPVVRLRCYQLLASTCSLDELPTLLQLQLNDRFHPIRRDAFRVQARCFPKTAVATWQSALLERSWAIRELAVFSLAKLGINDKEVAKIYRDRLRQHPEDVVAVNGLAETGDVSDESLFRELLQHPYPNRRSAAVKGLIRIGEESVASELLPLLNDSSRSVSREVCKAVGQFPHLLNPAFLVKLAVLSPHPHVRCNAVSLISSLGKWRSIPWLLRTVATADKDTALIAESLIEKWHSPHSTHRNFTGPDAKVRLEISQALIELSTRVKPALLGMVKSSLDLFQ